MKRFAVPLLLFILVLGVYMSNRDSVLSPDSRGNIVQAMNIALHGRITFSEIEFPDCFVWGVRQDASTEPFLFNSWDTYVAPPYTLMKLYESGNIFIVKPRYVITRVPGDRYAGSYGFGTAFTAAPFFFIADKFTKLNGDLRAQDHTAHAAASFLAALSAVFVFLICRIYVSQPYSLVVTLIYAFCTSVWCISSQSLWQHPAVEFYVSAGIFFFLKCSMPERKLLYAALAGFALGMAVLCRQVNAVIVLWLGIYLLVHDRKALGSFVLAGIPVMLLLFYLNKAYYGDILTNGQMLLVEKWSLESDSSKWKTPHLLSLLFSPARGLFVYSPVLLFSVAGALTAVRTPRYRIFLPVMAAALSLLLIYSFWYSWWGGWSYSYRIIVDIVPLMIIFLIPLRDLFSRSVTARIVLGIAILWSFMLQLIGTYVYDVSGWNYKHGMNIDSPEFSYRLWSWRDNPVFYYLGNVSNSLEKRKGNMEKLYRNDIKNGSQVGQLL